MNFKKPLYLTIILLLFIFGVSTARAQEAAKTEGAIGFLTTEFTYQGKLNDGSAAANGNYDFEFKLTDDNGSVLGTIQRTSVQVKNGIFTVRLDFGFAPFNNLNNKFLEIGVRKLASEPFSILTPRQPVTATPIAIVSSQALNANFAGFSADSQKLGGVEASGYVGTNDARLSDARQPLPGSTSYIQNTTDPQNASFNVSGSGTVGDLTAVTINSGSDYGIGGNRVLAVAGTNNLFAGVGAGSSNTSGAGNSFVGNNAGFFNSTGIKNSFFGNASGLQNQTGSSNSLFGAASGSNLTSGSGNSFFGAEAGVNTSTASNNSFFGISAGAANTTGINNAYFGANSGIIGNASGNAFFGAFTGSSSNTGGSNSFFGAFAGFSNQTGQFNTFLGSQAGYANTDGLSNVFVGALAGNANTVGSRNTIIGNSAGMFNTTGEDNIIVGRSAGGGNATGNGNILIGRYTGNSNRNGNNNILIGNDIIYGTDISNSVAIGFGANVFTSNTIVIGTNTETTIVRGQLALNTLASGGIVNLCIKNGFVADCSSSIRYKKDIENFTPGLDLVKKLRPVSFTWIDGGMRDVGFVAEEVAAIEPLLTTTNGKGETEGVKYDRLSTALVNAVNEQQTEIEAQRAQIKDQQTQIEEQARLLKNQQEQIEALKKLVCASNAQAPVCGEKEPKK